jgi:hypothetical protein
MVQEGLRTGPKTRPAFETLAYLKINNFKILRPWFVWTTT